MNQPKIPVLIKRTIKGKDEYEFTFAPDGETRKNLQSNGVEIYEPFFYDTISVNRYVPAKSGEKDILIKSLAVENGKLVAYTLTKENKNGTITTTDSKEESPLTSLTNFVCPYADSS